MASESYLTQTWCHPPPHSLLPGLHVPLITCLAVSVLTLMMLLIRLRLRLIHKAVPRPDTPQAPTPCSLSLLDGTALKTACDSSCAIPFAGARLLMLIPARERIPHVMLPVSQRVQPGVYTMLYTMLALNCYRQALLLTSPPSTPSTYPPLLPAVLTTCFEVILSPPRRFREQSPCAADAFHVTSFCTYGACSQPSRGSMRELALSCSLLDLM